MKFSSIIGASVIVLTGATQGQEPVERVHPKINPGDAPSCRDLAHTMSNRASAVVEYPGKQKIHTFVAKNPQYRDLLKTAEVTDNTGCTWSKDIKEKSFPEIPNSVVYKFAAVVHGKIPENTVDTLLSMK